MRFSERLIERRVEHLDLIGDHHYAVRLVQQIRFPRLAQDSDEARILVPVGYFRKSFLPDLDVKDSSGRSLEVLSRPDRSSVTAELFVESWRHKLLDHHPARPSTDAVFKLMVADVADVVNAMPTDPASDADDIPSDALEAIGKLKGRLARLEEFTPDWRVRSLCRRVRFESSFWEQLRAFATTRLIIAACTAKPGEAEVFTATYSDHFDYHLTSRKYLLPVYEWLGWVATGINRRTANVGNARSLWVVHATPDGVDPVRCFWDDDSDRNDTRTHASSAANRAVAARYTEKRIESSEPRSLVLEVQIAPSAAITGAIALSFIIALVSTYIYQTPGLTGIVATGGIDGDVELGQDTLVSLASAFAAVPAAVAGALAFAGPTFVRRLSRGPRTLLAFLAFVSTILAILISLRRVDGFIEATSLALSVYSYVCFCIFAYIKLGPRWRNQPHSRWKRMTRGASPRECRDKQIFWARLGAMALVVTTVVYVRVVVHLHSSRILSDDFPHNIFKSLWINI